MAQIIHTERLDVIQREVETKLKALLYAEMVDGGLLAGVDPMNVEVQRVFTIGNLAFPAIVGIREQTNNVTISGHTTEVQFEYSLCALCVNQDEGEAEVEAMTYVNNIVDIMVARNDRSLGGTVFDVKHLFTSPIFRDVDNPNVSFAVSRFRIPTFFKNK